MAEGDVGALLASAFWNGVLAGHKGGWQALLASSELLAHGGLDARDSDGTTLLHAAAAGGDLPIIAALLHCGADPFIPDNAGRTAEHYAAASKHDNAAAMLALVAVRYEYARRYTLPNFDIGAALGTLVRTVGADQQDVDDAIAAQHSAWLSSQRLHGKPVPGAPLRALRSPRDLGNRSPPAKLPKWLPDGWTPPPQKERPQPEPEQPELETVDSQGRPLRDAYQGAALSGLSESGPSWQRYDLAVRVVDVRSTRRPTMLVAQVVGSHGNVSGVRQAEFTEAGSIRFDWVVYGGLGEITELQLGIDPAALYDEEAIRLVFQSMDVDGSGELEPSEVRQLCESLAQRLLSQAELASALTSMDPDGDGTVVFEEFFQWWKSAVGDPRGIFSSLFAMGCKVEKANLCLPDGGQAIFTPRCWIDVRTQDEVYESASPAAEDNPDQEDEKPKLNRRDAVALRSITVFPVMRRLKPPAAVDPSAVPKPGARRGAKNWPGLGDIVELAGNVTPEDKRGEPRCLTGGGAVGQVVGEATGKGGVRRFRVAADTDAKESWYEVSELAPHKVEGQGYVAKGSLMEQRKSAESHVLSLGLAGMPSWPLHLLYGEDDDGGEEMLLRLGRHGIFTTAQLRNAITAVPWAVQGLTDDEIQGTGGVGSLNYPPDAYYSGKAPPVSVGKKGTRPPSVGTARPCVLNHRLLAGTPGAKKKAANTARRQWINTPAMDMIMETIGLDSLAEFAGGLGDTSVIPGRFLHTVGLRCIPLPQNTSTTAKFPPVSAPVLTALLSADLLHLRPTLWKFGLCDSESLLTTLEGVQTMDEGQLMSVPFNKLLREYRKSTGDDTIRSISVPTLQALAGRVAGRQSGLDLTELDGCRLTGRRGIEWDAVPQNLSHKTLDLLAKADLNDTGKGSGQPGDVVYIEGNMPLLLLVPYGGADAQGGKNGGGSAWWNDWTVTREDQAAKDKELLGVVGSVGLARAVHAAIGSMCGGQTPHVVVNQLRAHWCMTTSPRSDGVDGMGDIPEGTRRRRSMAAWDNYHTFVEVAKGRMQRCQNALLKKGAGGAVALSNVPALVIELEWVGSAPGDCRDGESCGDNITPWLISIGLTGRPLRTAVSPGTGRASMGGGTGGASGRRQILRVFKHFDTDGSGSIDATELRAAAAELGLELCEEDTQQIMLELDADGSGQIELQEFEDWFSGLLGGESGQLEQLQVRAVLATSSVWGITQRQQLPIGPGAATASPREVVSGTSSLGAHLSAFGFDCTPSPHMSVARLSTGVPMQLPKVSFSLLAHGSAAEGGTVSVDAMAIYAPSECNDNVDGEGGWGERLGMGLVTFLAAQYSWQSTPCAVGDAAS